MSGVTAVDRAQGSLWGLAWGDVLGVPIESWTQAEIAAAYGSYDALPAAHPPNVLEKHKKRLRPIGFHSDDTQQALALLNVALTGWSPKLWGACLVRGSALKAWRGTGRHFDAAIEKLEKGKPAEEAGSPSAGIGAAMRIAPLGALYATESRRLSEVATESSAVTHGDLRSIAVAYAVAFSVARCVAGASAQQVRQELPDAVAEAEDEWLSGRAKWTFERAGRHQLSLTLARLFVAFPEGALPLGPRVVALAKPYLLPDFPPAHPNHGFALLGGVYGLAVGLLDEVDPARALLDVVRQGQDTDTVAAIAGGVLGARFGHAWVPKERFLDRPSIHRYAEALVSKVKPETMEQLLQREAGLTAQEKMFKA